MKKTAAAILMMLLFGNSVIADEFSLSAGKSLRSGSDRQYDRDTALVNSLVRKGFSVLSSKKVAFEEVKVSIDSAVQICSKRNIEVPASLHLLLARYHFLTGDLRTASEEASMALKKSSESRQNDILTKTYLFLGDYYRRTGMFQESMEYYNNAVSVAAKQKMKKIIPLGYTGISNIYYTLDDMKGYRENLQLLIESAKAENDSAFIIAGYHRFGSSFLGDTSTSERRNFRVADSLLRKSVEISSAIRDTSFIALSTANLGWNFYLEQKYDSSIACYERSLKYSIPGKLLTISANSLGNLGTIYRDLGQTGKALAYYRKGISLAHKDNDLYELWWIHRDMSDLYLRNRDTANAYLNYVFFKKYSDVYNKGVSSQGLADARIRYEADTHNKEVELLSLRLKNNRLLNYGFAGFILFITFIGLLLFRGSKLKDKRKLSELNRKVSEITQANLRQQMNPHFIFNTLNSIQYYMYQHDKIATNNYLTKFSTLMRKVLDNSRNTSVPLSDELSAVNLYLELEKLRFRDKFEYSITIDDEIDPLMHKIPTMLIQPYVENSINHGLIPGEGKGLVSIDLKLMDGFILCTIEDNGIGRDASREMNKKRGENHNSLGTQITASRLDLVNELYGSDLKIVYTDLKNEKNEPQGTKVEIHIPIIK